MAYETPDTPASGDFAYGDFSQPAFGKQPSASTGDAHLGLISGLAKLASGEYVSDTTGALNLAGAGAFSGPFRANRFPRLGASDPTALGSFIVSPREWELEAQLGQANAALRDSERAREVEQAEHAEKLAAQELRANREAREALEMYHLWRDAETRAQMGEAAQRELHKIRTYFRYCTGYSEEWHPYMDMEDLPSED